MKTKLLASSLFASVFLASALVPAQASATVIIKAGSSTICITGKKNPDACDKILANNITAQAYIVDNGVMAELDAQQGTLAQILPISNEPKSRAARPRTQGKINKSARKIFPKLTRNSKRTSGKLKH